MIKDEVWSVSLDRAVRFFDSLEDVEKTNENEYRYLSAVIRLTELKPKGMGIWAAKRIKLHIEGNDEDTEAVYHRFFIQFLSTGG
ncbi:MAG: hypothetical protein IKM61_00245 [Eubacteriaceae bacterium]|nr:hypothetical protein [Eubacteriaceae bacterium]